MGAPTLLLLVLFASSCILAQEDGTESQNPSCPKDSIKFRHLRKYIYNYDATTSTGVTGTADSQSGSKFNCKVELEVPQPCNYILRIKQCTLREVYGVSSEGKALFKKAKNSEDFSGAMSKYEVNFSVQDGKQVILYPKEDEPINILNIKRGIISALLVPDETQETSNMDTVYGKCKSEISAGKKGGADVTVSTNLKTCDQFAPFRDYVSPIALFKGLNTPLSTLVSSSQSCQYTLETKRKHVTEASCVETHLFLPFSHKNQYGMMAKVTQTLKLEEFSKINSREFADSPFTKGLVLEAAETSSSSEDAVLENLAELQKISSTEQNQQRANRFHKLVTALRTLKNETLGPLVPRLIQLSSPITLQALAQCGTPECFGAILQVLRIGDVPPFLSDTVTYGLGLMPAPCTKRIRELLNMAQYRPNRASFYALGHAINNFYEDRKTITPELREVADFMSSFIDNECAGHQDKTFLTLKAIGIMGNVLEEANPQIKSSILKCVRSQAPSFEVQKAAVQAVRKMAITDDVRNALAQVFQDGNSPVQKRLAAYLILMKNPSPSDLRKIIRTLHKTDNEQMKNFVASHIVNIQSSQASETQELKGRLEEALKSSGVPLIVSKFTTMSKNYQISQTVDVPGLADNVGAKVEGNIIYDFTGYMPREAMLETTLNVFGESVDMFEIAFEGKGFEPTLDALFGKGGFFPDSATKALYWVDGKIPDKVTEVLYKWFGVSKQDKQNQQDLKKALLYNMEKLVREVRNSNAPEAKAYLEILGTELGYLQFSDFKTLGEMMVRSFQMAQILPGKIAELFSSGSDADLFIHYIFMDNQFSLPTGSGLQLQVSLSGIIAPGTKAGMRFGNRNVKAEFSLKPAVAVEFVTQLGIQMPEFSKHAVQMNTNLYHESGVQARFSVRDGQFKFSIPAPTTPTKLFSINNKVNLVFASKTEVMPSIVENREERTTCSPLFTGLNYCTMIGYSNASSIDAAPYFPLTGETRYELEIQPTGEVQEYSLTAGYSLNREERDYVDTVQVSVQAEGVKSSEARLTVKYNRNKIILTSNVEIPNANVNFGGSVRVRDESSDFQRSFVLVAELNNQQVSEVTFTGKLRYDGSTEGLLSGELSIPKLRTEAKTEAILKKLSNDFKLQLKSSASVCALSGSHSLVFLYDDEKIELDWSTASNSDVQKIVSNLPDVRFSDFASYPESLKTYANKVLDHKVAQTDMTVRHIASQSVVATNDWLQAASKDSPYAQVLSKKLHALRDMDMQQLGIPAFPDDLFLNSDGKIKYTFNKESITFNIPLPFAGKTSHQVLTKTVKSPPIDLAVAYIPAREFKVPAFTIPEYYPLRVPLLGVLDLSSNINSNYYNWSASYTGGNTTTGDIQSYALRYQVRADCIMEILSYNIDGSAKGSYDPREITIRSYEGSLRHTLLDAGMRLSETYNMKSNQLYKGSYSYQARSVLGFESIGASSVKMTLNNRILVTESDIDHKLNVASLFANSDLKLVTTINTESLQTKIESTSKFDSSFLKATNKLSGMFLKEAVTMSSTTDLQDGAFVNIMSADYRNRQLTLKSDTNGNYYNLVGLNKFELTLSRQMAAIRSEYQADYKRHRFYSLLSGSLNSLGLELNADVTLNNQANRGAHKATLRINRDGLSTSSTTNVNFNPLLLESELNAGIGSTGAVMKLTANGRYREYGARISVDGKGSLSELSLAKVYHATLPGVDSKHVLNFKVNKEGLKFSNNLLGSYGEVKLEISNDLTIADYDLQYTSKFENSLSPDKFHKHKFDLGMQLTSMTAVLNNELQYGAIEFTNTGQVQLQGLTVNANGNLRGAYYKDEIKHSYGFSAGNMAANINTDTIAKIQGTAHIHQFTLDIAGASVSLSSNTNCESKVMRFTNRIRSVVQPFTITIDSQTNGDGRLMIFGEQTGQLYSKFILKAEPLSFNLVHDYRGSTKHVLGTDNTHETLLDYNINLLFTPSEQLSSWKLKSRFNRNAYNQDISAFNNADNIGVQLTGQTLADLSILDKEVHLPFGKFNPIDALNLREGVNTPQEFSISGHIKYDKNKDMHIINLPFIEDMGFYFEKMRAALLNTLQALQKSLKDVDIDQVVQRYRRALDTANKRMNDYVNSLDLEKKANLAKEKILSLAKGFKVTSEEMYSAVEDYFQRVQARLQKSWTEIDEFIKENYDIEKIRKSVEEFIQRCVEKLKAFDIEYKVREKTIEMIQNIKASVEKININDLEQSFAAWIQNLDEQYQIKASIQRFLHQIQVSIQKIDVDQMAQKVKDFLETIEISKYVQQIKNSLPFEKIRFFIDQIKNLVLTQLEEFEVSDKINAVIDKFQDFVAKYDIDKKIEVLIEKFIEFLNQQKVKETIQKVTEMLNNIDLKRHCKKVLTFVDSAVKQVRDYDFKKLISDINYYLDALVQKMRSFNYDKFVDDFNTKINELTELVNDKMRSLELPQKAEALGQYLNDVRIVVIDYLRDLKKTKLAAVIKWYEDIMASTVLIEWKTRAIQHLEDIRDSIYAMNIKEEFKRFLEQLSQAHHRFVVSITGHWMAMAEKITEFAQKMDIQAWADKLKVLVEEGFVVPEIDARFIRVPSFEVSLRALREATFRTPYFIVPFTDLQVQSVEINFRTLRNIEVPTRFVTPEFTIFNTYLVPSYVIDLNEIKLKIVRIIDQMISSDYTLPSPDFLLRDITMSDMGLPEFSIPEFYIPDMQLPVYKIPKLNLENFQFPDMKIPEFQLPEIPHSVSVPTFGKLSGSFKVASPFFTMSSSAEVRNSTASEKTPEMIASLSTEATSMIEALAFTLAADARISAPLMEQLILKETVALSNKHVKLDHFSEVTFTSNQIQTQIHTKADLKAEKNTAVLQNTVTVKIQKRITADMSTKYSHRLNIPQYSISSQLDMQNDVDTTVDIGRISLISSSKGNWRWTCPSFTDEGTHLADVKFNLRGGNIELVGTNKINDKYLKLDQSLKYDSVLLNYVSIDLMSKADAPNVGNSIATLKGKAQVNELKVELEATHNAELSGRATGTLENNFSFLTKAFEMKISTANNGNFKVSFPLKLTGRIEFLNNYDFTLNPTVQQVSWQANGKFNQYRVASTMLLGNNEENIEASLVTNGEANLDFLTIPVSIPEIHIPYTSMKTSEVRDFSVWEKTGLKNLMTTTRQNFDLNIKLQYQKNKETHLIPLPLDAIFDTINTNMKTVNKKFESGRDKTLNYLMDSYSQAKAKFDNYRLDNQISKASRTFRIPGYTIPLVNIEVSSFSAELPVFGYLVPKEINTPSFVMPVVGYSFPSYNLVMPSLEMPVLHVPNSLRRLSLPKLKLPSGQNGLVIPALGNLTFDFFFKSNVISLTTSAGIYNQSDVSARVSAASTSVIEALQFNLDATTGLTRKRGLKLATAIALKSVFAEGKHESSISFGKRNIEASVLTNAKLDTPLLKSTLKQELTGNTKTKATVSSKITLTYDMNDDIFGNMAKGKLDHTLNLEGLTSYFSMESKIIGDVTGTLLTQRFSGTLNNDANTYMNSNGLRSTMRLVANSKADGLGVVDLTESLAVESSTSRIYAVWEHKGENYLRVTPLFTSTGQQSGKATFELALWSLLADLQMKISQPNSFIDAASLSQGITLNVNTDKQEFSMNGQGILQSLILSENIKLSNDQTDARIEAGGSLQGHVAFLKSIVLPVYGRSLWDVLKLDVTTHIDRKQSLDASTTLIYTKSNNGFFYPIPSERIGAGSTITFPGLTTPEIQFPPADIKLLYTTAEGSSIPLAELSAPQYEITISKFALPKKVFNLDFNSLFNKIADIDLPTIEIPEQKIVIAPIQLRIPAGIYIPAFGSVSGTIQFASPVYNLTWTNKLENNPDSLVGIIDATSSSTLRFLEFDLDASLASSIKERTLNLIGQGSLAHLDLSANWKEEASFNFLGMTQHNFQVDITSPTFSNAQIRCKHDENGLSSSVSSPSTGTLGLLIEKESKTIKLKVYSRSAASPEKEVLILKNEISLKNPEKIQNKLNWREEAAQDVLNGLKEKLPKMSDAIYNCVNKYHKEHLGMDMKEAGQQIRDSVKTQVSSSYNSAYNHIDKLEYQFKSAARGASGKYAEAVSKAHQWYQNPADMPFLVNDGEMYEKSVIAIRKYQSTMKEVIDAAITFLKSTKFQLPGQKQKYTGEEQFAMGMKWAISAMEQCIQKIQKLLDDFIQSVNNISFNIPGTNVKIESRQIILAVQDFLKELQVITKRIFNDLQHLNFEGKLQQLKGLIQEVSHKSEKLIEALKSRNYQDIQLQTQQMYNDAINSQYVQYLSNLASEIKKSTSELLKVYQNIYEELLDKLRQLLVYVKALREEYLDPNIVGWSVKYYEIEEKVIQLFNYIIETLKELPSKYGINVSEISDQMNEYYKQTKVLLTNAEDKGRKQVRELSMKMEERVSDWSRNAKQVAAEYSQILKAKLHEAYDQMLSFYEKFHVEANRLIDLVIEKYNAFIEFLNQMLQSFQNSASEQVKTYVSTRKGELKVEIPHPFDWKTFDEIPQVRKDIIEKRMEIARSLVLEGIEKGSKQWEELQRYIEKQIEDGKLTAQQIIESVKNRKKN